MIGELHNQLILAAGCPALILYGRRRTGKSTILRNLDGFLPAAVHLAPIDMLSARATESLGSLIAWIAEVVGDAIGNPGIAAEQPNLEGLRRLLEAAETHLAATDGRLLLAIDEYERLDAKIADGTLPEALLATIRNSIQTQRRVSWVLAGSHDIGELTHAAWSSYLINARTVIVPMFTLAETRLLLTEPMRESPLWKQDEQARPRFDPSFWRAGGIERIHAETGGWPDLVQWVAEATIDLLNESSAQNVEAALLEQAFVRVVERAHSPLLELVERERQWRLRVPLMRRWLQGNG